LHIGAQIAGRTIFLGPKTEQGLVHLIFFRPPHASTRLLGQDLIEGLNFRCMPDKCQPTIFVPAEENPNG
jgi:hypothetical protein